MAELAVTVGTTAEALAASLGEFASEQLPFATAVAMTRTARDASEAAREHLPKVFTLRDQKLRRSFVSTRAEKRDWPNMTAKVGTLAEIMVLQETGGTKRPKSGSNVAVPTRAIRRTKTGKISAAKRPRRLLEKPGVRKTEDAIVQRTTKRNRLGVLYLLRPQVRIKKRLGFEPLVQETFERRYPGRFAAAMNEAIASRKSKAERAAEKARTGRVARGIGGR